MMSVTSPNHFSIRLLDPEHRKIYKEQIKMPPRPQSRALLIGAMVILIATPALAEKLGLQLYSLRNQMANDLPATLAQISEWGLDYVEGGGSLYGYSVDDFRDQLRKNGLKLISVDTTYQELRDNPIAAVYKAKFYDAEFATFYSIPHDPGTGMTIADTRAAVDVMNEAGELLKANGVTLQYHPHGFEFRPYGDGTLFDVLVDEVTEAQFQMDVFWVRQAGTDPVALLRKYPGRFTSLHLKDRAPGTPDSDDGRADDETNVTLGQGDVGIAAVVSEARRQGIPYYFLEDESSRVMDQVPKGIAYVESLPAK
jgi:sugar phosphate isomerase/epimerase